MRMTNVSSERLLSLDVLRGITIAGMILVNNPGSWGAVYAPLRHAVWHGLTPTDLVFPFFMFIMGVSACFSLRKYDYRCSGPVLRKIFRRVAVLFLIGLSVGWFARFCGTFNALSGEELSFWERVGRSCLTFDRMRTLGVMQRLALGYGAASLLVVTLPLRFVPWTAGLLLAGYWLVLALGDGFALSENNIVAVVDRAVLGTAHMYREGDIAFDPEGLLSTVPSVAHVLVGFCCGRAVLAGKDLRDKISNLLLIGAVLMLSGWLLSYGCPINEKILVAHVRPAHPAGWPRRCWACRCGSSMHRGRRKWCRFFEVFVRQSAVPVRAVRRAGDSGGQHPVPLRRKDDEPARIRLLRVAQSRVRRGDGIARLCVAVRRAELGGGICVVS